MNLPQCLVIEAGLVPYDEAEQWQEQLVALRRAGQCPDLLLLLEHPPVVTLGRGTETGHEGVDRAALAALGVPVREVARGGLATYHAPGQLIGYPIIDLRELRPDLHWYLRSLEQVLIDALADLGCSAHRRPGATGVWVGERKVASIGIAVRGWVTWHGFALNIRCHSPVRHYLAPCGMAPQVMASLDEIMEPAPGFAQVSAAVIYRFGQVLGRAMKPADVPTGGLVRSPSDTSG